MFAPTLCCRPATFTVDLLELHESPQRCQTIRIGAEAFLLFQHIIGSLNARAEDTSITQQNQGCCRLWNVEECAEHQGPSVHGLQRKSTDHAPQRGHQRWRTIFDGIYGGELSHSSLHGLDLWWVWRHRQEYTGITTQGDCLQASTGKVATLHLRSRSPRQGFEKLTAVESIDLAAADTSCTAFSLHSIALASPNSVHGRKALLCIVGRFPDQASINDNSRIVDGHGTLSDGCGQDDLHLSLVCRFEGLLLLFFINGGVHLHHPKLFRVLICLGLKPVCQLADFSPARQKDQNRANSDFIILLHFQQLRVDRADCCLGNV
mmetsp:Transcript_44013/g.79125  ORF Transcript_44013/g.79125 Transcript_44013/m.79125 type:complete len:320 (+) Transcript_44013:888-1847(+)